ncbi:Shedu anti-phage system protein SduA domain-containing protein [Yinghuangia sp. YIM S09857]|uniref:Shedu anti-phage system protein SduA domain-containing protein n=1 Tax=Yinghuangia sp. YIM S09857 TaxID=3436929 RepID=UPI003F53DF28
MENYQPPLQHTFRTVEPDTDPERPQPLPWDEYSDLVLAEWYKLLSHHPEEDAVQTFLELHPAMIPGGSGDIGPGGHHGSEMGAVFRRPNLIGGGRTFEPDFMWVTRSSGLVTPILIEIEKPSKRWFKKDGRPTSDFTEARDQLNDWRSWFARDGNHSLFRDKFLLLGDRYYDRPLEPQYVLIYGRDSEFQRGGGHANPGELRFKRDAQRGDSESFMSFDALRPRYDHRISLTLTMTASGPRIHAFSPMYGTGAHIGDGALLLGDPQPALSRTVMMTDERRNYLAERWKYWQEDALRTNAAVNESVIRQMGIE